MFINSLSDFYSDINNKKRFWLTIMIIFSKYIICYIDN
jgi:hypothetical protein